MLNLQFLRKLSALKRVKYFHVRNEMSLEYLEQFKQEIENLFLFSRLTASLHISYYYLTQINKIKPYQQVFNVKIIKWFDILKI